ncbi:hypothetical protein B0J18DRAFT_166865 [Chaetomium sp. MPI-SDFR-AT-0129]|nr:hypothetical protein B0J18DRAFT_166865 [Chaetomium sp. MPI-SDFR-AT-0129]
MSHRYQCLPTNDLFEQSRDRWFCWELHCLTGTPHSPQPDAEEIDPNPHIVRGFPPSGPPHSIPGPEASDAGRWGKCHLARASGQRTGISPTDGLFGQALPRDNVNGAVSWELRPTKAAKAASFRFGALPLSALKPGVVGVGPKCADSTHTSSVITPYLSVPRAASFCLSSRKKTCIRLTSIKGDKHSVSLDSFLHGEDS